MKGCEGGQVLTWPGDLFVFVFPNTGWCAWLSS
jgi:hypothetical protein